MNVMDLHGAVLFQVSHSFCCAHQDCVCEWLCLCVCVCVCVCVFSGFQCDFVDRLLHQSLVCVFMTLRCCVFLSVPKCVVNQRTSISMLFVFARDCVQFCEV